MSNDTKIDDGGPAYPAEMAQVMAGHGRTVGVHSHNGMTLRDYFAGQALASEDAEDWWKNPKLSAETCYVMADAMLKARNR